MFSDQETRPGPLNVVAMQQRQLEGMEFVLSVLSRPIEMMLLRPWHGTLYYKLPVVGLSTAMMLVVPAVIAGFQAVINMIPFSPVSRSVGLISLGNFSEAYFLASMFHAYRLWRRMTHMADEDFSEFEGPGLVIFQYIPWGSSFYTTRIVYEPLFVLLLAIVLQDLFIIEFNLAIFLYISAFALFLKSTTTYFRGFIEFRMLLDAKNKARILAKFAQNTASPDEIAKANLAAFPKNVDPTVRAETIASMARAYSSTND